MEPNLEGIETLRIVRADGNLKISGGEGTTQISDSLAEVTRDGALAEVRLRNNATVTLAPGVTLEIIDTAGNLELRELAAPVTLDKVRGNFNASRIGALAIRSRVGGNAHLEHAGAIECEQVSGNLSVEDAKSVHVAQVAGDVNCGIVAGEIAIEKIGSGAKLFEVRGKISSRLVAGSLEVADAAAVQVSVVGGKVRSTQINGDLEFGKIGGKLTVDGLKGDLAAGFVGGRASIARAEGKVELFDVGGAAEVRGAFKPGSSCTIKSRGRISVEVPTDAALNLSASAGWSRVRIYGLDTSALKWSGRARVEGTIGAEPADGERARLDLDTPAADIIVSSAAAEGRDYCGREGRFGRRFSAPFEDFAADLGEEIPEFVSSVLDSVSKFVSDSGVRSGSFVRDITRDVSRGIREGINELERAMADLGDRVPSDIKDQLAKLGRDLSELLREATVAGANATREERHELREKMRRAVREMRDAIREAARAARPRSSDATRGESSAANSQKADIPRPGETVKLSRDEAILQILRAVKEGRLEPEEADDLINAWTKADTGDSHSV